jgi:hypothetical protein
MQGWNWFDEYEDSARRFGDAQRHRLGLLHRESYRFRESDPDRALALIAEGRRLAESLHEPWWALYYDEQRVHALLHFKQDYRDVLDLAVRNTLEVRKTAYAGFPRRLLIHGDLVSAYLGIDPLGHADAIREALGYLDREAPPDGDERYLVLGSQRQFALDRGAHDEALALSHCSLALAAADSDRGRARHFLVFTWSGLADLAFRLGEPDRLAEAARAGEEVARQVGHQVELAGFQLWQALLARRAGDEESALALYAQASARLARLGMPPDSSYRDAECAFHEEAGDLHRALAVRLAERAAIERRGRLAYECACHLKCCRLLASMGRLTEDDLGSARAAAQQLRDPAPALAELARLARQEGRPAP